MRGTTTHFRQAVVTVLIALAAAVAVAWNHGGEIKPRPGPDESPVREQGQVRELQPAEVAFAADLSAPQSGSPSAGQTVSPRRFVAPVGGPLSYLLIGGASSDGGAAAKARCMN